MTSSPPRSLPSSFNQAALFLEQAATRASKTQQEWEQVAAAAKSIADGLKNHELRTSLGNETTAITAIGQLMQQALQSSVIVKMELCRVVGNACFDHDENRQLVLDANIPLSISIMIDSVMRSTGSSPDGKREKLSIQELRMLRGSVGALLNSSLKFDPIRKELARTEIVRSLLSLVDNRPTSTFKQPVTFVGAYTRRTTESEPAETENEWQERLVLGETIGGWTMNVLEDVLSEDNKHFPAEEGIPILSSILLSVGPYSTHDASKTSIDPVPTLSELSLSPNLRHDQDDDEEDEDEDSQLDTSIELLSISAALLEGLSLDHDSNKRTIAFSAFDSTAQNPSLLYHLLEFIEFASPPTEWTTNMKERSRLARTFVVVKAAVVRAVVESVNDDEVMHELWKLGGESNWVVEKLASWLVRESRVGDREDLMVCASHMLAGLGRSDRYVERLVHDYGLVEPLADIIKSRVHAAVAPVNSSKGQAERTTGRAGENTQILYGVVSLMRHLAIPLKNRPVVASTKLIPVVSQLLAPSLDIVKPLQMSVIGLLKHLTNLNVTSSIEVLLPVEDAEQEVIDLILALIKRTDEVQLRSESTRILINLVRSLYSQAPSLSSSEEDLVQKARIIVLRHEEIVAAISEQVRLSEKYPILVSEGIVALSLLSSQRGVEGAGADIVISELLRDKAVPSSEIPPAAIVEEEEVASSVASASNALRQTPPRTASLSVSPSGDPSTALGMLTRYLSTISPSAKVAEGLALNIRPEMISNVSTLLVTTLKNSGPARTSEKAELRNQLRPLVGRLVVEVEATDYRDAIGILKVVLEEE